MTQRDIATIELRIKEERVAYWESYHRLPSGEELTEYVDDRLATI